MIVVDGAEFRLCNTGQFYGYKVWRHRGDCGLLLFAMGFTNIREYIIYNIVLHFGVACWDVTLKSFVYCVSTHLEACA